MESKSQFTRASSMRILPKQKVGNQLMSIDVHASFEDSDGSDMEQPQTATAMKRQRTFLTDSEKHQQICGRLSVYYNSDCEGIEKLLVP